MEGSSVRKLKTICVFCGAKLGAGEGYISAVNALGSELVKRKISLVYGRGSLGLMGSIAITVCSRSRSVMGIIPEALANQIGETPGKEVRVTTIHERIMKMLECADAFIALPGGYGTLEELFQMTSCSLLKIHQKPIGILNINGFFNSMFSFLDHAVEQKFLSQEAHGLLISASNAKELIDKLEDFPHATDSATSQLKQ